MIKERLLLFLSLQKLLWMRPIVATHAHTYLAIDVLSISGEIKK